MSGTKAGAAKAMATIIAKHGLTPDGKSALHFRIGADGGAKSGLGGFASEKKGADGLTGRERARVAGARGGRISRRRSKEDR